MIARAPQQAQQPAAAVPLRPGANVRMGRNPLGFWVEGPSAATDFSHPFPVYVSGGEARVGKGLVIAGESFEPVIGKVPVSGDAKHPQPTIKLDDALVDDLGQTWVCVEATPDKDGKLDPAAKTPQVVVVQRDHPSAMTGDTGRAPLALIVKIGACC